MCAERVATQDHTAPVIEQYLSWGSNKCAEALWSFEEAPGTSFAKLRSMRALNEKDEVCFDMSMNKPITLRTEFWMLRQARVEVSIHLYNQQGFVCLLPGISMIRRGEELSTSQGCT
jgi:hypothetical protein